jgi:hypothetical protein
MSWKVMTWHVGGIGHLYMAMLWDCWDQEGIIWLLRNLYQKCNCGKTQPIYWAKCWAIQLPSYRVENGTGSLRSSWFMGRLLVQTVSWEHRVNMKFREWMLSKGYFSMGTMMEDQEKVIVPWTQWWPSKGSDCTVGTLLIEGQEGVTVPWAHCWGPSTYVNRGPKGLKPINYSVLFFGPSKGFCTIGTLLKSKKMSPFHGHSVEGQTKVTVTCAQCWGPNKGYCHMCTVLRTKQRLLSHGHSVETQAEVAVTCAQCWGLRKRFCSRGTVMSVKLLAAVFSYVWH